MDSKCASAVSDTRTDSQCEAQHDSSLTPKLIAANALAAEQKKEKYGWFFFIQLAKQSRETGKWKKTQKKNGKASI